MNVSSSRQHVLLVGIDAYPKIDPLYGCVNDVDALETVFLDRLHVDPMAITKLVAPHAGALRTANSREDKPTAANFRKALEELGTDKVRPGDRVFFHYSGHGTQIFSRITHTSREALVPVDARDGGELLFDDEINELLRRIAARTDDLTVVLDGCCSAGATRSTFVPGSQTIRYCHFDSSRMDHGVTRHRGGGLSTGLLSSLDPSDPGFLVAASAQSSEAAHEGRDARGVRHGAFTAALLDVLARQNAETLSTLRWVDIWQLLRARVTAAFPRQHPCLVGRSERRVFGGAFQRQDPGLPMTEVGGTYHIHAGSLVGLSTGAEIAVYGSEPVFFRALHSMRDVDARRGLLRVESATLNSAIARPVGAVIHVEGHMEDGARGRLVKPGQAEKLVVGLDPFDADLARFLENEAPVVVVPLIERGGHELEVVIGLSADGSWWLGDDIFGPEAPLARIAPKDRAALARVLWHSMHYNLPLRLARRCPDNAGMLRLRVLDARRVAMIEKDELNDPQLPEVETDDEGRYGYRLKDGQPVCFSVENRSMRPLYTHVINCASSGKVEILGPTQFEVPAQRRQTFWMGGLLGKPFPCSISTGRMTNVERLVVIGTTSPEVDLQHLRVRESYADALSIAKRGDSSRGGPRETWTATMVTVKITRE